VVIVAANGAEQSAHLSLQSLATVGEHAGGQDRVEGDHHVHEASYPEVDFMSQLVSQFSGTFKHLLNLNT
jgi:hypothetical protein